MPTSVKETGEGRRLQTPEQRAELGKRIYDLTTELTTNLLTTPEFMTALGRVFFEREMFRNGSRLMIRDVFFQKGDFEYRVGWESHRYGPSNHEQPERELDSVSTSLYITKYDPKEITHDSTGGSKKKVAKITMRSEFLENNDRSILRFIKNGSISLYEDFDLSTSEKTPRSWRDAQPNSRTVELAAIIDKLPEVFTDLYPAPTKQ